eukprot:6453400-Ditylum_brightwellii.AAC.1
MPHKMQDVIKHLLESGLTVAPKWTMRHIQCFDNSGCAVGTLPHLDTAGYRGQHKFMGAVHPDGLLSNLKLNKDGIALVPSASGWVIQRLYQLYISTYSSV